LEQALQLVSAIRLERQHAYLGWIIKARANSVQGAVTPSLAALGGELDDG
jgi:hypothetical protein